LNGKRLRTRNSQPEEGGWEFKRNRRPVQPRV
jgi:hypothetical protein